MCLSVEDSGTGLDPKLMHEMLDAFYTTESEGTGIGLAVSRSIIESHGGRIWVELNDGPGAKFSFSLPNDYDHDHTAALIEEVRDNSKGHAP